MRPEDAAKLGIKPTHEIWSPFQVRVLNCMCEEIGLFGGKASGKSTVMRGFLIRGNPDRNNKDEKGNVLLNADTSYIYHPEYRGLILRKNEKDLDDFIQRAARLYKTVGGEFSYGSFRFPSGAVIDCGHMKDKTSWQKYIGIEYQRIAIDEAGLIPEYDSYEELKSCMRTPYPDVLRRQIILASNAGGPGTGWIMDRFMLVKDKNGDPIPHDTKIRETYKRADGELEYRTRIWMFSTLEDNPVYKNSSYAIDLLSLQDPKKRAAYLEGKWDALWGSYFGDVFRPNGPHTGEPANADHVVHKDRETLRYPVEIKHWWPRHIGFDWGYSHESAILWGARSPDGRIYVYREMVQSQLSAYRAGYEIAIASRSELEQLPSKSMTIWMGQDAFGQRGGDRSYAELVAMGIASVLGQDAVHLPDFIEKRIREAYEMHVSNPLALNQRDEAIQHLWTQRRIGITIRKAEKASTIGWQHMREMMRWESTGAINANFDRELYFKILREDGEVKANEYARVYRDIRPEVLPKLQIFDCCQRVISSVPKLQHKEGEEAVDDKHFVGRDCIDSLLYLNLGIRDSKSDEPYEEFRDKHITEIKLVNPNMDLNDLIWVNRRLEEQWQSKNKPIAPYTPPRHARIQRMLAQGKIKGTNTIDKVYHRL